MSLFDLNRNATANPLSAPGAFPENFELIRSINIAQT